MTKKSGVQKVTEVQDMLEAITPDLGRIMNILKAHKKELEEKYGVSGLGVFGSFVRGEQRERSDIDILVEFKPDARISLLDFVGLEIYLSDLLKVKVDLVEESALKPRIGRQILAEVVRL